MNIHLFRSDDCEPEVLNDVYNLLSSFPGPMQFRMQPETSYFEDFSDDVPELPEEKRVYSAASYSPDNRINFEDRFFERQTLSWNQIFEHCRMLREQHDIGKEEFLVLLTTHNNNLNWFSAGNPDGSRDHFVHTEDWDYFLGSDRRFPIAYQIATGVLKKFVFNDYSDLSQHWHQEPRGCMLDFCQIKKEVSLKVRTGDICPDCLSLFEERKAPSALIEQVFAVLDGIRSHMLFKTRFQVSKRLPELHIKGQGKDLVFPELGGLQLHLNPLEKTIYHFFLRHEEGVLISHLSDYFHELMDLYLSISTADSRELIERRTRELSNPRSNSCSEKISKIKKKIVEALGEEMAQHYIISGANGTPKRIRFDRSLLVQ
jgi:hypothetical protein